MINYPSSCAQRGRHMSLCVFVAQKLFQRNQADLSGNSACRCWVAISQLEDEQVAVAFILDDLICLAAAAAPDSAALQLLLLLLLLLLLMSATAALATAPSATTTTTRLRFFCCKWRYYLSSRSWTFLVRTTGRAFADFAS